MIYVNILFTRFEKHFTLPAWNSCLRSLPIELQKENSRFMRWQDRHSHLLGKLLINEGLIHYGYKNPLSKLKYNQFGRPYLNETIDFNISHSGKYVICSIVNKFRIGIDIEKIALIDFSDFASILRIDEWHKIMNSTNPTFTFYQYWTIKESIIKAEGKGLSIPLKDIHIDNNQAFYNNGVWFLKEIQINEDYSCHLAINNPEFIIQMQEVVF